MRPALWKKSLPALQPLHSWHFVCQRSCSAASATAFSNRSHGEDERKRVHLYSFVGAAGAAALALLTPPVQCQSDTYFEDRPDGSVDRIKRWSRRSWSLPSGVSPSFHMKEVNPALDKHLIRWTDGIKASKEGTPISVLVPLCGKSFDMPYLANFGMGVVGVEGVPRAILEFKAEHRTRVKGFKDKSILSRAADGSWSESTSFEASDEFQGYRTGKVFKKGSEGLGYYGDSPSVWKGKVGQGKDTAPIHIINGDMFEVTPQLISAATFNEDGRFDLVLDRGSLDALPPHARTEYVKKLNDLVRPGGRILLIVHEYDQQKVPFERKKAFPPPFSVSGSDVKNLFSSSKWSVEVMEDSPAVALSKIPAFSDVTVREVVYLIEKRGPGMFSSASTAASTSSTSSSSSSSVLKTALGGAVILGCAAVAAQVLRKDA